MTLLSDGQLAAIGARADAATPGPWTTWDARDEPDDHLAFILMPEAMRERPSWNEIGYISDDYPVEAEFIAAARDDVPALLAHIAALGEKYAAATELADAYVAVMEARYSWDHPARVEIQMQLNHACDAYREAGR